jgi:hypothetical protein
MDWWHRLWDWIPEKPDWWFAWRPVFLEDKRRWAWLERVRVREKWHMWDSKSIFDPGYFVIRYYYSLEYHGT